jgi:hypothetical protein
MNPDALDRNKNLQELVDKAASRDNLGLGNSAVLDVGFGANQVADGAQTPLRDGTYATGKWAISISGKADTAGRADSAAEADHAAQASNAAALQNRTPGGGAGNLPILDANGKIDAGDDKIIISTADPDPAQGAQNWLWLKV